MVALARSCLVKVTLALERERDLDLDALSANGP